MKGSKRIALTIAAAALAGLVAVSLTACGSDSSSESTTKTYTVATEPTYPPFESTNDDGEIVGFDVDLMKAIAKDQGFKVKFKNEEFDSLIPSLKSGDSDIVIACMQINDERKKQVDFSDPYYSSGTYLLVKKDNNEITNWSSFKKGSSYSIAAQSGTTCQDICEKLKKQGKVKKVVLLNQFTTCVEQLDTGVVDAVVVDKPIGDEFVNKYPDKFKLTGDAEPSSDAPCGIAVKKGNSKLLKKINAGLKSVKKDGTYDKLLKKWNIDSSN